MDTFFKILIVLFRIVVVVALGFVLVSATRRR